MLPRFNVPQLTGELTPEPSRNGMTKARSGRDECRELQRGVAVEFLEEGLGKSEVARTGASNIKFCFETLPGHY